MVFLLKPNTFNVTLIETNLELILANDKKIMKEAKISNRKNFTAGA